MCSLTTHMTFGNVGELTIEQVQEVYDDAMAQTTCANGHRAEKEARAMTRRLVNNEAAFQRWSQSRAKERKYVSIPDRQRQDRQRDEKRQWRAYKNGRTAPPMTEAKAAALLAEMDD
jgi:hypothetical protein